MISYNSKQVQINDDYTYTIVDNQYEIQVLQKKSKKIGVMIVGICGNNGTTFTAGILAHQLKKNWETKDGTQTPKFYGSVTQSASVHIGYKDGFPYTKLYKDMLDLYNIDDIIIGGWDICSDDLYTATVKNKVLDVNLREQLKTDLQDIKPLKGVYYDDFIANGLAERATNILDNATKYDDVQNIIENIQDFKDMHNLDDVIVVWSGSTERFNKLDFCLDKDELIAAVESNNKEIPPSMIYALAAIATNSIFLNCSPQNTLVPALIDLATHHGTFVAGDDLKSGQTRLKSVLADFLVSTGIKPLSIVSYNHLGNLDGKNLSEYPQFRSKEITKKNVIDDIVDSNPFLFEQGKPNHVIDIKYVPAVGDSKRAMDEYYSEIFLNGKQTISLHNTCEDSLLAAPIILDIVLLSELLSRVRVSKNNGKMKPFSTTLSLLSFFFKAPVGNGTEPLVNSFFRQKSALDNFVRILNSLPPIDYLDFENRI